MNDNLKLFIVEFGEPDAGGWISFGGEQKPLFVIALDYNEAANKAMSHAQKDIGAKKENVLDENGFLKPQYTNVEQKPLMIKSVKLAANEIIW